MHEEKDRHGIIAILCPGILNLRYSTAALGIPTDEAIKFKLWPVTSPQIQVPPDENIESCHLEILQKIEQGKVNISARKYLLDSDWKVTRHNEQISLGGNTSLTDEEYIALTSERQEKRDLIIDSPD